MELAKTEREAFVADLTEQLATANKKVEAYERMMTIWERWGFAIQPAGLGMDGKRCWWRVGYTVFADKADMTLTNLANDSVVGAATLAEALELADDKYTAALKEPNAN